MQADAVAQAHPSTGNWSMKSNSEKACVVGADIASRHIDVARGAHGEVTRIGNDTQAITRWLKSVPAGSVVAMESTGRYHLTLARLAHERGLTVYVLNARDVRHYANSVGKRGKTDRMDAQLLARYIERERDDLHAWKPLPPEQEHLAALLRQRASVMRHKSAIVQSLREDRLMGELLASLTAQFDQALKAMDAQIRSAVAALPQGTTLLERISSIPGVGLLSGAALLQLFLRLGHVRADAVVGFTGLDPRPMESGNKRGKRRLSKRGPPELRRLLYNAAMSASRTAAWSATYANERAKGLPSTAALVVLARKIVRVAYSLFKTESFFDPSRLNTMKA